MTVILSATLRAEVANSRIASNIARSTAEVFAEKQGFSGNIAEFGHAFELSISEAFTNSVRHGNPSSDDAVVTLAFESATDALTVRVGDKNTPFNSQPPCPEITKYPESGFGLFIIGKLMDKVTCERDGMSNILTMTKRIGRS